jgi:tyrosyl-DNA phosphodiesterase 1
MVILRHDELAQVIIHTANMIEQDWRNMTQGVWLSPLLSLESPHAGGPASTTIPAIGTGARFKRDFMAYLRQYGTRTTMLVSQLDEYDFSAIRAALVAHVPSKFDGKETEPAVQLWGWPALKRALGGITQHQTMRTDPQAVSTPHIICQVSSIASLSDKWIKDVLFSTLSTTSPSSLPPPPIISSKKANATPQSLSSSQQQPQPKLSIIFPTPQEIRTCLDGYAAGASIHCKLQNAQQRKQFDFMKPYLCHWNGEAAQPRSLANGNSTAPTTAGGERSGVGRALRGPAAPHIKTFIRFQHDTSSTPLSENEIEWALLTSANLSTQAWGSAAHGSSGEVRVCSYELGVLVWPGLFLDQEPEEQRIGEEGNKNAERNESLKRRAIMLPTFASDTPTAAQIEAATSRPSPENADGQDNAETEVETIVLGLRMPYDLPLSPYRGGDEVWSAKGSYAEEDRFGRAWNI